MIAFAALLAWTATPLPAADPPDAPGAEQIRAWIDVGRNEEAAAAARELLASREIESGPRSLPVAEALELLARALACAHEGDPTGKAERLAMAERALSIRLESTSDPDIALANSHYVVGLVHNLVYDWVSSEGPFRKALEIVESLHGRDAPETAPFLREYGTAVYGQGRHHEALEIFLRHLAVTLAEHGKDDPAAIPAFYNVALAQSMIGNLESADTALGEAERILKQLGQGQVRKRVTVGSFRGTMMMLQGRLADALEQYRETLAYAEQALGPDDMETRAIRNYIGRALIFIGDDEEAEAVLAAALATGGTSDFIECSMLFNLARARHSLGKLDDARLTFEEFARQAVGVIPETDLKWTQFHSEYAALLFDLGRNIEAAAQISKALEVQEEIGSETIHTADTLTYAGGLNLAMGNAKLAVSQLERAVEIVERVAGSNHRYHLTREDLAEALLAVRNEPRAFSTAVAAARDATAFDRSTIALLPHRQALTMVLRPDTGRDVAMTLVLKTDKAPPAWRRQAYDLVVQSRSIVFDESVFRNRRWAHAGTPDLQDKIDSWTDASRRVANLFVMGPRMDPQLYEERLKSERDEVEQLERDLARSSADFLGRAERKSVDSAALGEYLRPGQVLVSYLRYGRKKAGDRNRTPHYAAAVLRPDRDGPEWLELGSAAVLDAAIESWRSSIGPQPATPGATDSRTPGRKLRRLLWDPLRSRMSDVKTVFIVPDGAIHLVGFAGLPDDSEDRYLVETGPTFYYLTTERDLVPLGVGDEPSGEGLLIVGDPEFSRAPEAARDGGYYRGARPDCDGFRSRIFGALPGTRRETAIVRRLWEQRVGEPVTELSGAGATELAVKRGVRGHRVVHLATHGFYLGDRCGAPQAGYRGIGAISARRTVVDAGSDPIDPLLLSGLVFAGANRREASDAEGDDGVLTAEEVGTLDLSGVELAVLSACRTGDGSVTEGEGVFGLRRAFLLAGARTVVTNLWDVEDADAQVWIEAFYRNRFVDRRSVSESVRAASLHVLKSRRSAGLDTHPFHWAGWSAVGVQ